MLQALRTAPGCVSRLPQLSCIAKRLVSYDGTPSSIAQADLGRDALTDNIETVPLAYDKHSPPGYLPPENHPIVFLHGLFGSRANNRSVSRQLAKLLERDVYCLDLRNHGDSPHSDRMDYPAMSADVERFISEHRLERPVLMGHSMGAKAAMAVCLRQPKLCSLLIPIDNAPVDMTAGGAGFAVFGTYVRQMQKIEHSPNAQSLKDCDRILAEVESNETVRQFLLTNMKRTDSGYKCRIPLDVMARNLDKVSGWPFNYELSRWARPTLFVRGTKSPLVADEYLSSIGRFFPRFDIEDVEAGHWLTAENPKAFIEVVTRWIQLKEDK